MFQIKEAALRIKDRIVGTPLERALEESTSADNDNLNVPTRLLTEISDKSFNQEEFEVIMKFIWLQLMSPPEKWRKILKTLNLINYCLKNGSPRFIGDIRDEIYQIRILHRFTFQEGGEDKGTPIREISLKLDQLLNDDQLLEQERRKADVVRDKLKSLQSFSSSSADNTGSKANRYEGFSSEDVGKFVKKTEDSSPESKESKGTESSPTKENENTNGNDFVIRQNTKYNFDLTKDDVPEPKSEPKKEEPTTTQLLDLLDMSSPPVPEQKAPIENIPKQDTIWNWDQPAYTKSESRQNQDFDWDIAPQPASGNELALPIYNKSESQPTQDFDWGNAPQTASENDDVLGNLYNRSQSTPADVKASPFEWDQAPVAPQSQGSTPSAEEKSPEKEKEDFDMFQSASNNNAIGGKNFSESEKAIIDLSDMGKEVKETKTTEQGGFLYSNQQEIDDMFASITIQNNMLSNPQMNSYGSNMKPNLNAMYGYPQNNMGNNFGNSQMGFGGRI